MAKKKPADDKDKVIRDRILLAKKNTREYHNRVKQWNKYWNGTAKPASVRPADYIFVNYVFAIIKNKISRLYYRNPFINVQARNPKIQGMAPVAKKAEAVVNKQMQDRQLGIRGQIKKSLLDWQRTGIGVFFTGWSTDLETDQEEVTGIKEDNPDFRRIHPLKVHLPPSFSPETLMDMYAVIEVDASLDDLKANKNYDQDVLNSLASASITYLKPDNKFGSEEPDLARVKTYHYYSSKERAVYVQHEDRPILKAEPNPYAEDFGEDAAIPLRFIWGDDDLESEWPMSPIQIMQALQMELNKTRTQKATHRKRFNRKYLIDDTVDSGGRDKLSEGQDGTMVPVTLEGGKNIANLVWPVPDAQQTPTNDEMDRLIKDDLNVVMGTSQLTLSAKSTNPTLGQDQMSEAKSQTREDEEQEMVEEFVESIYTALLQLDQKRLQTATAVKITGDPTQEWQELSSDDIQGEFSLKVVSGSMVRETDATIRQEAGALMQVMGGIPMFYSLMPKVVTSILDTYPVFSGVAEEAKKMISDMESQGIPLEPPPPQSLGRLLVGVADLLVAFSKAGVQLTPDQLNAIFQRAGLPPNPELQPPQTNSAVQTDIGNGANPSTSPSLGGV